MAIGSLTPLYVLKNMANSEIEILQNLWRLMEIISPSFLFANGCSKGYYETKHTIPVNSRSLSILDIKVRIVD